MFSKYGQVKDIRMIKDRVNANNNEIYKPFAFVEFFELESANKALEAINERKIILREEILTGNYSKRIEDSLDYKNITNNQASYSNGQNVKGIFFSYIILFK